MKTVLIVLAVVLTMMTGCTSSNRSSSSTGRMNPEQSQNKPAATAVPKNISVNEAKEIALNYFDQNEQSVVFDEIKTVLDDGRTVIEIEMTFDHKRYEIEIDAKTGAVLEVDEEKDYPNK